MTVIFTHVPKTAGSTINHAARALLTRERAAFFKSGDAMNRHPSLHALGYIGGHVRFYEAWRRFPEARFIVSLRNPLHRALSNYHMFLRGERGREFGDDITDGAFLKFYERRIRRKHWQNLQCQFIGGERTADAAIERLTRFYELAWLTERTDEAWPLIRALLTGARADAPARPRRVMVGANKPESYDTFLAPHCREMVEAENAEDMKLVAWLAR